MVHLRVDGADRLQLQAHVVGAVAGLLFKCGHGVGIEGELVVLDFVAQGDGVLEAEAVVVGTNLARTKP